MPNMPIARLFNGLPVSELNVDAMVLEAGSNFLSELLVYSMVVYEQIIVGSSVS